MSKPPLRDAASQETLQDWIRDQIPARLGPKSAAVIEVLLSQPGRASYGSVHEVATLAGANEATVTRLAQSLGYEGWPAFQSELRARYLSHLSAPQVAEQHGDVTSPSRAALRQDLDCLSVFSRQVDHSKIGQVAKSITHARRTYVLGDGSYAALAAAVAHNIRLAGYDVEAITAGSAEIANRMAYIGSDEVLIVISFWRLYETAVLASQVAKSKGARVFAITDVLSPSLEEALDGWIVVPAEGASFFPSMTCGLAVLQALVTEVAAMESVHSKGAVAKAEQQWQRFSLLHHRVLGSKE